MARLDALLAHVLIDVNDAVDAVRLSEPGTPSLPQWANFLRVVPDDGLAPNDIALAARVSRRSIKSRGRAGLPTAWIAEGFQGPRKPWWRLTDAGRGARDRAEQAVAAADTAWREKVGRRESEELHAAAAAFVAGLELELSHYPMAYGGADGSAIGGRSVPAKPGPPRLPAHGTDWKPVLRAGGDTVGGLPLYALISQVYVAFQVEFEQLGLGTMSNAALLGAAFPTPRVRVADLPSHIHVDGSGKTSLERHGIVRVEDDGGIATAVLTEQGRMQVEGHEARLDAIVEQWRAQHGATVVDDLRSALVAVDARLAPRLPDHCVVRWWHDISKLYV